jgi:hypothetical protein
VSDDPTPELLHEYMESLLERFDREYRVDYKSLLAAGGRCLAPVWIHEYENSYTFSVSFNDYAFLAPDLWMRFGPQKVMANLAYAIAEERVNGEHRLVPKPPDQSLRRPVPEEAGAHERDIFAGLGLVCNEWRCPHEGPDGKEHGAECPDREFSDTIHLVLRGGTVYTRRHLGTPQALTRRGYMDVRNPDTRAWMDALEDDNNAFEPNHVSLMDIIRAISNPLPSLAKEIQAARAAQFAGAINAIDTIVTGVLDAANVTVVAVDPKDPSHPSRLN